MSCLRSGRGNEKEFFLTQHHITMGKVMQSLYKKLKDNFIFEKLFWKSKRVSSQEKFLYTFRKYCALLLRRNHIIYLGEKFLYDNPNTPALLQGYPHEIEMINNTVNLSKVKTVFDIGANIGQWGYTLKTFFPHIKLVSFEANSEYVFHLLTKNALHTKSWNTKSVGIGNPSHKTLYFTPNASAEATIQKVQGVEELPITLITLDKRTRTKYLLPGKVDLVKIDVEGAEMEVLNNLKDLKYKFLSIEVAVKRKNGIKVEDVLKNVKNSKLLYLDVISKDAEAGNAIFAISSLL